MDEGAQGATEMGGETERKKETKGRSDELKNEAADPRIFKVSDGRSETHVWVRYVHVRRRNNDGTAR